MNTTNQTLDQPSDEEKKDIDRAYRAIGAEIRQSQSLPDSRSLSALSYDFAYDELQKSQSAHPTSAPEQSLSDMGNSQQADGFDFMASGTSSPTTAGNPYPIKPKDTMPILRLSPEQIQKIQKGYDEQIDGSFIEFLAKKFDISIQPTSTAVMPKTVEVTYATNLKDKISGQRTNIESGNLGSPSSGESPSHKS